MIWYPQIFPILTRAVLLSDIFIVTIENLLILTQEVMSVWSAMLCFYVTCKLIQNFVEILSLRNTGNSSPLRYWLFRETKGKATKTSLENKHLANGDYFVI